MKPPPVIRRISFEGLDAIELTTSHVRLVVVTACGPRVAFLGRPLGDNLLYWAPGKHRRGSWDLMGGHRATVTRPGADESEESCADESGACEVKLSAGGFTVTGALDPAIRTRRGLSVRALAADRIRVDHFVRNESDLLWSGGLWGLTCTVPQAGASYVVPLGDGSSWDYATVIAFRQLGGGRPGFDDPQFRLTADALVLRPRGRQNKRMIKADAGLIAWHDPKRRLLFAKQAAYFPNASYPLGTNLALFVGLNNFMVEMETMGPAATLKPNQTAMHTETWLLQKAGLHAPATTALRRLFD